MFRVLLIVFFLTLNINVIYSQLAIKGIVKDAQDIRIEGVTVVMQDLDSTFIDAAITDNLGVFCLKKYVGDYRLIFQHILYVTKVVKGSGNDAGSIILEEKNYALGEIMVRGERPQVKVENGTLTYDISRLAENKVISNAYEFILQLPGIHEQDGKLSLVGTSELTVILNGKPTTMNPDQLSNILKNTPVSKVTKAELIYNAPAHYRVRGAVINVVLKQENTGENSFQGEFNAAYQQKYYENGNGGISLAYSSAKLFVDFLYSLNYNKVRSGLELHSRHLFENDIDDIEQENSGNTKSLKHNIRLASNYSFTPKDKISFTYTGTLSPDKKSRQQSLGNFSTSNVFNNGDDNMNNVALDYQSGFGFTGGGDYTYYNSPTRQNFTNQNDNGDIFRFVSNSNQKINRWKAYMSQVHNMSNDFSLNYGIEFTYVNDKSYQTYHSQEEKDLSLSNSKSDINEYTYNIYAGIDKKIGNLSFSLSLAGEYYKIAGDGEWSVYPTAQLNHINIKGDVFQLSFSADKSYPNYWLSLNNVGYLNGYMETHGNPYLKPAEKYSARLNYILKRKYIFSMYYNYINDYFIQLPYQSSEKLVLIYQMLNLDSKQEAGASIVVPFRFFDFWDSSITLDGNYSREECDDFHSLSFNRNKWQFFSRMDNTFIISSDPDVKVEIAGMYISPSLQGIYDLSEMWQMDAGIKWTSINKKAELRLKGTDLFNTFIPDLKVHYDTQNLDVLAVKDNRSVMLSFSYKFGDYKKKTSKSVDTSRFGH
ncbi:MAG: TonB-dependent receptor family protein [Tannerella sp.]|jgi:hypothetical protein|nr:TonB-dependent receptor family protein [Tannerella sp.]